MSTQSDIQNNLVLRLQEMNVRHDLETTALAREVAKVKLAYKRKLGRKIINKPE